MRHMETLQWIIRSATTHSFSELQGKQYAPEVHSNKRPMSIHSCFKPHEVRLNIFKLCLKIKQYMNHLCAE